MWLSFCSALDKLDEISTRHEHYRNVVKDVKRLTNKPYSKVELDKLESKHYSIEASKDSKHSFRNQNNRD